VCAVWCGVVWCSVCAVKPRRGGLTRPPAGNEEQDSCDRREQETGNGRRKTGNVKRERWRLGVKQLR
jgi:hypothetical protein